MSKLKEVEKLWDEYCKSTDIKVTSVIEVQLNPSEPSLKVGIFKGDSGMHFTLEEIKSLAKALEEI